MSNRRFVDVFDIDGKLITYREVLADSDRLACQLVLVTFKYDEYSDCSNDGVAWVTCGNVVEHI